MYSFFYGKEGNVIQKYFLTFTDKGYSQIIWLKDRSNLTVACKIMSL